MAFLPPVPGGPQPGLGTLVGGAPPSGNTPQEAQTPQLPQMGDEASANEGSIQFLRDVELRIERLTQDILQIGQAYPGGAQDTRNITDALSTAKQSLTGLLVSIVSQMQAPQPQAPRYGAL